MSRKKHSIGIDFGTESARILLVEVSTGRSVASVVHRYRDGVIDRRLPRSKVNLPPDTALQNPNDYLGVLKFGVPAALRRAGVSPNDVIGLGVDFTSCTLLPIDADGNPLCWGKELRANPHSWVKLWKHHAAQPEADRINEVAKERHESFLRRYGGKISSEWFFPKLLEVLNDAPEIYAQADKFIEAGDWIVLKLTGHEARSACQAGYKGMWSAEEGFPPRSFFAAVDPRFESVVDEKVRSTIHPMGARAGRLTREMADLMGLKTEVAVPVAVIDAHSAVPASTVTEPGKMVVIMGTSGCHMICDARRVEVEGISGYVYEGILPGLYGYEAGQASMGDVLAWFTRILSGFGKSQPSLYRDLERKARKVKPGATGLLALEWLNGCRTPLVDADLSGVLVGLTLGTSAEEIYRALLEAIAFGTNLVIETFEKYGINVVEVYACGGLPEKNALLMQIVADVTGREILVAESPHTSALGAAMWGAVAAGASTGGYDSIVDAAKKMARVKKERYIPNTEANRVYRELYEEYVTLQHYFGRGVNPIMKKLKGRTHSR
jgi:L-ribulokinase